MRCEFETVWEQQRLLLKLWTGHVAALGGEFRAFSTEDPTQPRPPPQQIKPAVGWTWAGEWQVVTDETTDAEGWRYSPSFTDLRFLPVRLADSRVRRRMWRRARVQCIEEGPKKVGDPALPVGGGVLQDARAPEGEVAEPLQPTQTTTDAEAVSEHRSRVGTLQKAVAALQRHDSPEAITALDWAVSDRSDKLLVGLQEAEGMQREMELLWGSVRKQTRHHYAELLEIMRAEFQLDACENAPDAAELAASADLFNALLDRRGREAEESHPLRESALCAVETELPELRYRITACEDRQASIEACFSELLSLCKQYIPDSHDLPVSLAYSHSLVSPP